MTVKDALAFIAEHGIVLERARGPRPNLVERIAGGTVAGSWWAHPRAHEIFEILSKVRDYPEIIACRLIDGKVTLIHRRVWPALVLLAREFPVDRLAAISERHTSSGKHVSEEIPWPKWLPPDVNEKAQVLTRERAIVIFGEVLFKYLVGDDDKTNPGQ
ncbi:MAG TPA: hypothetical protein VH815_11735 [Acidobacteriota bacterium]